MARINQLGLKSRLMILLLGVSFASIVVLGALSWLRFRSVFRKQAFDHLVSVRAAKGKQLETYISTLQGHVATLSEDRMVVAAMVEMGSAYRELQNQVISDDWLTSLERYYRDEFLPTLAENVESVQIVANYRPTSQAGQYLQHHYLVNNEAADAADLIDAADGSRYSAVHARYHELFHHIVREFGYEDLYLIDFNSGEVVYSVHKQVEYGTSLDRGPYRRSNLAAAVEAVREDPGQGFVQAIDYRPYVPAYSSPTAFFAAPIYNGPHLIGVLAVRLPTQEITALLTGNQEWSQDGLGETGQVYLVGDDFLMRSVARPLLEDAKDYQETLERIGLSPQTVNLVEQLDTSILLHPVETESVESALAGTIATRVIDDYRGVSVLSSYAPLRLAGLRWIILAEMDRAEAFGPLTALQIYMGILGVILVLLVAWLSNFAAQNFVSPIQKLLDITDKIRAGERDIEIEIGDDSRLDQLEDALQGLLQDLQVQESLVTEKAAANTALLNNMMPPAIAARMVQEGRPVMEALQQVTLLVVRIGGLSLGETAQQVDRMAAVYDRLIRRFDEKARYYGVDTQLTLDSTYIASCGVAQVFLDHQERTVDFALELVRLVESEQEAFPASIDLQIGIHTGQVVAGALGGDKFMYKLLGPAMAIAQSINQQGGAINSILVTKPIYERLKDRYLLVPRPPVKVPEVGAVSAWMVFTQTERFNQQVKLVQVSSQKLMAQGDGWANHFFNRLLTLAPNYKTWVPDDVEYRNAQAAEVLQTFVKGLNQLEQLLPTLQTWGHEANAHNLSDSDFEAVDEALVWALEKALGIELSPDLEQAWLSMSALLSGVIREAAMQRA